ncbi:MAG TPA: UPF0280 family protein, partial [Solidesulfovibrio sp.]|nr:UPF0280 family protein [Desulfovibrio sp.]HML61521.1 UPF0280 family protein [Solidesulfovibrio sp.]
MPSVYTDSVRAYRQELLARAGEQAFQVVVAQTDLFVLAARDLGREVAAFVSDLRRGLETYILLHPDFRTSLTPVAVGDDAPAIARDMAEAAARFGVGPFAAVAGAISQAVADAFAAASPEIVVENGGDIFLRGAAARTVALLA